MIWPGNVKQQAAASTRNMVLALAALLWMVPGCGQETAQDRSRETDPVTLEARLDRDEATIGDRITYTLMLSRMPEIPVEFPEMSTPPDGVTPVDTGHSGPQSDGGRILEKRWMTCRVDAAGTVIFPAVVLRYRHGGTDREAKSMPMTLRIKSVLPPDMTDIRGLKPLEKPKTGRGVFIAAVIAAVLILSAVLAWYVRKKRNERAFVRPPLSPDLEAAQRLGELAAMGLLIKGDFKRYYFLLSEIFRQYLERRFAFPALDRTPEEILADLDALSVSGPLRDEVRAFLGNSEPVKFAGAACGMDEAVAETDRVKRFIDETRQEARTAGEVTKHVAV